MEKQKRTREICYNHKYRDKSYSIKMCRIYRKDHGTWKRVGWICLGCGSVIIDNFKRSREQLEPKIAFKGPKEP